jgi:hypothetical protein
MRGSAACVLPSDPTLGRNAPREYRGSMHTSDKSISGSIVIVHSHTIRAVVILIHAANLRQNVNRTADTWRRAWGIFGRFRLRGDNSFDRLRSQASTLKLAFQITHKNGVCWKRRS